MLIATQKLNTYQRYGIGHAMVFKKRFKSLHRIMVKLYIHYNSLL